MESRTSEGELPKMDSRPSEGKLPRDESRPSLEGATPTMGLQPSSKGALPVDDPQPSVEEQQLPTVATTDNDTHPALEDQLPIVETINSSTVIHDGSHLTKNIKKKVSNTGLLGLPGLSHFRADRFAWGNASAFAVKIGTGCNNFAVPIGKNSSNFNVTLGRACSTSSVSIGEGCSDFAASVGNASNDSSVKVRAGGSDFSISAAPACNDLNIVVGENCHDFAVSVGSYTKNFNVFVLDGCSDFSIVVGPNCNDFKIDVGHGCHVYNVTICENSTAYKVFVGNDKVAHGKAASRPAAPTYPPRSIPGFRSSISHRDTNNEFTSPLNSSTYTTISSGENHEDVVQNHFGLMFHIFGDDDDHSLYDVEEPHQGLPGLGIADDNHEDVLPNPLTLLWQGLAAVGHVWNWLWSDRQ